MPRGALTRRGLIPLALGLALPGCGFRPVYGPAADGSIGPAARGLGETNIAIIPERFGQLVRQALQARFDRAGSGLARRYDLSVTAGVAGEIIGFQPDSSATYLRLVGTASWTLTAEDPQRSTLTSGTAREVDGLDVLDQQFFAVDLQNEATQRRIAEALGERITLQLAVFFNKRAAAA
jgi:LPS-assembly lipoprotein